MSNPGDSKGHLGPSYDSPDDRPSPKRPPFQRFLRHGAGLFKTTKGHYINGEGVEVFGRMPRTKVENPITTVRRPTFMSESMLSTILLPCTDAPQTMSTSLLAGWPGQWTATTSSQSLCLSLVSLKNSTSLETAFRLRSPSRYSSVRSELSSLASLEIYTAVNGR